jgi:hypothetical protein
MGSSPFDALVRQFPLSGFREGGRGMGKNLSAVIGQEFFLSERYVTIRSAKSVFSVEPVIQLQSKEYK